MERNAHYALVGLISMALFVGLVVFVVWLAQLQFTKAYDLYDVDFKGPVRGLSSGGEVFFNGIKVGEVTKLSLDRTNPNRVVARVRVNSDAPVRVDSTAGLEPLGITGVNYIQISAGTLSKPLLKEVTPAGAVPVIHTTQSQLESLLEGGGTVLARAVDALDRVNRLLSDRNIQTLTGTLEDVHGITTALNKQKTLFTDLDRVVRSLDGTGARVNKLADDADVLVNGDAKRVLAQASDTIAELKATAVDVRGSIKTITGPANDFAVTGLPQLTRSVTTLQQAAESLDRLVGEVERNPQQFVGKAPAKELVVKP